MEVEFILYVSGQERSREFYSRVLGVQPVLDVPGMTEFLLSPGVKLGLMPESGITKILSGRTPHPSTGNGVPRCEVYLKVTSVASFVNRALEAGAVMVSETADRDWGDKVCYLADPDGHILAIAEPS